jgi:magnesium chelatase family protein
VSVAQVSAISLLGLAGEIIQVESDVSDGVPSYSLLGLPDAALSESRDRVRAAIVNSELSWPNRKVVVSLSPAWLPKSGSSFDLPIALSLLAAQEVIPKEQMRETIFIGELALDGSIRPIRGVLPILIAAARAGIKRAVIPAENNEEASLLTEYYFDRNVAPTRCSYVVAQRGRRARKTGKIATEISEPISHRLY